VYTSSLLLLLLLLALLFSFSKADLKVKVISESSSTIRILLENGSFSSFPLAKNYFRLIFDTMTIFGYFAIVCLLM
jgi:hypothetical protein